MCIHRTNVYSCMCIHSCIHFEKRMTAVPMDEARSGWTRNNLLAVIGLICTNSWQKRNFKKQWRPVGSHQRASRGPKIRARNRRLHLLARRRPILRVCFVYANALFVPQTEQKRHSKRTQTASHIDMYHEMFNSQVPVLLPEQSWVAKIESGGESVTKRESV